MPSCNFLHFLLTASAWTPSRLHQTHTQVAGAASPLCDNQCADLISACTARCRASRDLPQKAGASTSTLAHTAAGITYATQHASHPTRLNIANMEVTCEVECEGMKRVSSCCVTIVPQHNTPMYVFVPHHAPAAAPDRLCMQAATVNIERVPPIGLLHVLMKNCRSEHHTSCATQQRVQEAHRCLVCLRPASSSFNALFEICRLTQVKHDHTARGDIQRI